MGALNFDKAKLKQEENIPHKYSEVVCLKCLHRFISVRPVECRLKDLECTCGEVGYIIETGEVVV